MFVTVKTIQYKLSPLLRDHGYDTAQSILSWPRPPLCSWLLGPPVTVSVSSHLCAGQQSMSYSVTDMKKFLNGDLHGDFGDFVKWMKILDDLKAKEDKPFQNSIQQRKMFSDEIYMILDNPYIVSIPGQQQPLPPGGQ